MPVQSLDADYKKWLASNVGDHRRVNTFEIIHATPGPVVTFQHFISDYGESFVAKDEIGVERTFEAIPLKLGNETITNTTEQKLTLTLDGLEGKVYAAIKALTVVQRLDPVLVKYRTYRDNLRTGPAITPIQEYIVIRATADLGRVTLELSAQQAPQRRAGQYATVDRFPGLKHL